MSALSDVDSALWGLKGKSRQPGLVCARGRYRHAHRKQAGCSHLRVLTSSSPTSLTWGVISEMRRIAAMCEAYDVSAATSVPGRHSMPSFCVQEMILGIHYNALVGGEGLTTYIRNPKCGAPSTAASTSGGVLVCGSRRTRKRCARCRRTERSGSRRASTAQAERSESGELRSRDACVWRVSHTVVRVSRDEDLR
ncbi:hypothetical protein CDEST_01156 [Colletotrichum destructivum]|uniref:Uncharacterized protein n=1 Tax=Colletotrichum destructivum TaxID=34406 RepID=A0AAX4HZA7_9PEZI|nr:hypothetical protein CDEST_01156 [Colletotrichum destructivum]